MIKIINFENIKELVVFQENADNIQEIEKIKSVGILGFTDIYLKTKKGKKKITENDIFEISKNKNTIEIYFYHWVDLATLIIMLENNENSITL